METIRIALLEDDESQRDLMERMLSMAGYRCSAFDRGKALQSALARESFDLCILDWEVPDLGGDELLVWMRAHLKDPIPVLFATARDTEDDIVKALELGADDFMTKPVSERQLLARVNALIRRARGRTTPATIFQLDEFVLDSETHGLTRHGEPVKVTSKDFEVALFLLRNVGRLLSRSHIYEAVWGRAANINTRTVDTHVSRVRVKLGLVPENGWQITPIYQYGYRLHRLRGSTEPGESAAE